MDRDEMTGAEFPAVQPARRPLAARRAVPQEDLAPPRNGSAQSGGPVPAEEAPAAIPGEGLAGLRRALTRVGGVSPVERRLLTAAAGSAADAEQVSLQREVEGLRRLLRISRELSSILDLDALLEAILDSAVLLTGANRGLLLLSEEERLKVIRGRDSRQGSLDPQSIQISETLAGQCLEQNRVIPHDNLADSDLSEARSIKALDLYSAVCVPLRERGAAIGVLYLDSSLPGLRTSPQEIGLLEAFASQAAISLLNARLHQRLEESRVLLTRENEGLRAEVGAGARLGNIIGQSRPILCLFERIRLLKDTDIPVLILGECGTGKELVARALHYEGRRRQGPWVPVNCAGFPEALLDSLMFGHRRGAFTGANQDTPGMVEQAEGGTLFLDEIGDMPVTLQVKLLRFLESGEFRRLGETEVRRAHTRIISATNQDLGALVKERTFREDLYFRVAGVRLEIPPLRERREDIPLLVDHFLQLALQKMPRRITGMTERGRAFLLRHSWPGNVRQLKYAIEGACALVPEDAPVDEEHIRMQLAEEQLRPGSSATDGPLRDSMARTEQDRLLAALRGNNWNVTRASGELGISRQHLHNRMRLYGLKRPGRA